jgi:imidazolonepropionase-like amidohydrolase
MRNRLKELTVAILSLGLAIGPLVHSGNASEADTPPEQQTLVIRGGTLFDGTARESSDNKIILIENGRIAAIGEDCEIPQGAREIDATGYAILPGLIDLHVHFGAPSEENSDMSFTEQISDYTSYRPAVRKALHDAGVTAIRSVRDMKDWILELKRQVASGNLDGPRVYCAGPIFTAPGGHPAGTIYRGNPWLITEATRQVDDPEKARAEVRALARDGVDGIKAVYDGRRAPRLSLAVLQAIIDETHKHDLWVAVHTHDLQELREAAKAGADSIEHGTYDESRLDVETVEMLKEENVACVPTLAGFDTYAGLGASPRERMENVKTVWEAGVLIGAGTDTQGPRMAFGRSLHREMELLVEAGLTPSEAILAATRNAAVTLRVDDELGTIEKGKLADLILVKGKPWETISDIREVRVVIQDGKVVVDLREQRGATSEEAAAVNSPS